MDLYIKIIEVWELPALKLPFHSFYGASTLTLADEHVAFHFIQSVEKIWLHEVSVGARQPGFRIPTGVESQANGVNL